MKDELPSSPRRKSAVDLASSSISPSQTRTGSIFGGVLKFKQKKPKGIGLPPLTPIMEDTISVGAKKIKFKKRFVMLDAQSLHVYVDQTKKELEDSLALLFCFVRNVPTADKPPTFQIGVYNKEREVILSFDDSAQAQSWSLAVTDAADAARRAALADTAADPRDLERLLNADDDEAAEGDDGAAGELQEGVIKAGYLNKKNQRGKWKKRWIVLTDEHLLFFNDEKEASNGLNSKDSLQLLFCSAKPASTTDAPHGFLIFAKDQVTQACRLLFLVLVDACLRHRQQTHSFDAESAVVCQQWITALQRAMESQMLKSLGQTHQTPSSPAGANAAADTTADEDEGDDDSDSKSNTANTSNAGSNPASVKRLSLQISSTSALSGASSLAQSANGEQPSPHVAAADRPKALQPEVDVLMRLADNATCADCNAPMPDW